MKIRYFIHIVSVTLLKCIITQAVVLKALVPHLFQSSGSFFALNYQFKEKAAICCYH